jgi:ArsR family transcriptional regulator, virulence genes transcriptional regulator
VPKVDIFELHAQACKTIANATRLKILALLARREMSVGELAQIIAVPMPNVSQHLTVLRTGGLVRARKEGPTVHYSLADRRTIQACTLIRSVLLDRMKERGLAARKVDPRYVVFAA